MVNIKKQTISSLGWVLANQFGIQGINFIVSIVLARLLLPSEFGLIGMIAIFLNIGTTLIDSGMTSSLIRTKDADNADYSSVFYTNLVISIIVYVSTYLTAPIVATFYEQPILTSLIRIYCISFIIGSFTIVQSTKLNKEMNFKKQLILNLPSLLIGSILGIYLAVQDYGVWSLVWMNITYRTLATIQLWYFSPWLPDLKLNFDKVKYHVSYGYKLTLSALMNTLVANIYNILIGKWFSAAQLGFFIRAKSMQELPVTNISVALNKVTFPLFAKISDDNIQLKNIYKRLINQVFFIITPLLILAMIIAEPLFRLLLTDKWVPAVPFFQIFCIVGIVTPVNTYNLNILLVKGWSGKFLQLSLIKNAIIICGAFLVIPFGINGLMISLVFATYATFFINAYYSGKLLQFSVFDQIKEILPILIISIAVGLMVYFVEQLMSDYTDFTRIAVSSIIYLALFLSICKVLNVSALKYSLALIRKK